MSFLRKTLIIAGCVFASPIFADEVNIYSYRQPELIKPLTDAFTEETGIKVNVAFLNKGMAEKLKAEGDKTPADVALTVDISRLAELVNNDLTQAVSSDLLKQNVPAQYRDAQGHWYGLTTRARIVYASKDRVKPSEITTYEDLASDKWKGRICTRSGMHPYMVALTSAYIYHHGAPAAAKWLEGIKSNLARKPQGNDRAQVKAIWAGECDISLGNTYYMGKMLEDDEQKAWAQSVHVLFPTFQKSGTHVNISGVALMKYAPNRDNGIRLIEFLTSPKAQEIYATANYEYPIAPGTSAAPLVQSWGSFAPDGVSLTELASLRPAALELTQSVDYDE